MNEIASLQSLASKAIAQKFSIWEFTQLAKNGILPTGVIVATVEEYESATAQLVKAYKPQVEKPLVPMFWDYYPEGIS